MSNSYYVLNQDLSSDHTPKYLYYVSMPICFFFLNPCLLLRKGRGFGGIIIWSLSLRVCLQNKYSIAIVLKSFKGSSHLGDSQCLCAFPTMHNSNCHLSVLLLGGVRFSGSSRQVKQTNTKYWKRCFYSISDIREKLISLNAAVDVHARNLLRIFFYFPENSLSQSILQLVKNWEVCKVLR